MLIVWTLVQAARAATPLPKIPMAIRLRLVTSVGVGVGRGDVRSDRLQLLEQIFNPLHWDIDREVAMDYRIAQLHHLTKSVGNLIFNISFFSQCLNHLDWR